MKYTAKMKDEYGKDFEYKLEAKDLFEADKRLKFLAAANGWTYISL